MRNLAMLIVAFLSFLFLSTGTTSEAQTSSTKMAKNLRNKAETMPEVEVRKVQNIVNKLDSDTIYAGLKHKVPLKEKEDPYLVKNLIKNQEDLEAEVEKMFNYIEMAEEDEIDTNNSMLSSAVKTMDDSIKFYLGRVFGYGEDQDDDDDDDDSVKDDADDINLTEEQLDTIAKKISERLEREAKLELKTKADSVKEEKVKEVKQVLAEDKMNTRTVSESAPSNSS
jgi:ribosomal protein S13